MDSQLNQLREELSRLEQEFKKRTHNIEQRITDLEAQVSASNVKTELQNVVPAQGDTQTDNAHRFQGTDHQRTDHQRTEHQRTEHQNHVPTEEQTTASKHEISSKSVLKHTLLQSLLANLLSLLGPLAGLFEQFTGAYTHYKNQGKAPVFLMTVVGIIALVLGFSYLLQYSFNEFLGPAGKILLAFAVAIAVTAGGILFTRKQTRMAEYGSGLIALGLVLNYLCGYFAGPYYGLINQFSGFLLLMAITGIAYWLAQVFETRIVAVVTWVGGACMPLIIGDNSSPLLYLGYLLILAIAMLRLSTKLQWQALAILTMITSAAMIEYTLSSVSTALAVLPTSTYASSSWLYLIELYLIEPYLISPSLIWPYLVILHGFFYAFAFYLFDIRKNHAKPNASRLIMISSNVLFFLFACQQIAGSANLLGLVYLANAAFWTALFVIIKQNTLLRWAQALALVQAGLFSGVGILALSRPEFLGLIWAIEGVLLLYVGSKFKLLSVRIEAYFAITFAFFGLILLSETSGLLPTALNWLSAGVTEVPELFSLSMNFGWANLIAGTAILLIANTLLNNYRPDLAPIESIIVRIVHNLLAIYLSLSFLLSIATFAPQIMWLLVLLPMFMLIYQAQKTGSRFWERLGLAHYALLFVPILISAAMVNSFHFSEQSLIGQIARVELFLGLWLIAEFYRRFCPDSPEVPLAENLRKLFYCLLPIFFLPSVIRQHSDYLPLALWLSTALALALQSRLNLTVLKYETRLLAVIASISAIVACALAKFDNWQGHASAALFCGVAFYLLLLWKTQSLYRKSKLGSTLLATGWQRCRDTLLPVFSLSNYYLAMTVFIVGYSASNTVSLGLLLSIFLLTMVHFHNPSPLPIRRQLRVNYVTIFGVQFVLIVIHIIAAISGKLGSGHDLEYGMLNLLGLLCCASLVLRTRAQTRAVWKKTGGRIISFWVFHLMVAISVIALFAQVFSQLFGPAVSIGLVIHATILLFQSTKPKLKKLLSISILFYVTAAIKIVFWDMQDFTLVQKIVVLMLVGLSMLAAAFKYQKLLPASHTDTHTSTPPSVH